MFELLQEDLEDCIELLKQITNETGIDRSRLLAELYMTERKTDIQKVVDLCEILVYHYNKINEQ